MSIALPSDFEPRNSAETLVVLLHAAGSNAERLRSIQALVSDKLPDTATLLPELPAGTFSFADPSEIAHDLLLLIDDVWAMRPQNPDGRSYSRIVLVGHSLGALLARKIYVYACGENQDAYFERATPWADTQPREWASAVERIILLAGINRGWTISHHLPLQKALLIRMGVLAGNILKLFRRGRPMYFHIRRGAPFITQLRIQWLSLLRNAGKKGIGDVLTIQLLGSIDDLVAPDDNVDLVTGQGFFYLDVPNSGHVNVVEMFDQRAVMVPKSAHGPAVERYESTVGEERQRVFLKALRFSRDELADTRTMLVDQDLALPSIDEDVTDVIFVIHGMRDLGFWTHKIARKVTELGAQATQPQKFATETSSYGFFPMLPFILSWTRRAKVEWLMDQYITDLVLYPKADFSFVGHSNGTYLLAKALEEYPACHFNRVVFAGSVVRTGYDWSTLLTQGRVMGVLNYVATADWVVALFPKGLQTLHLQDLGSAGHDGFRPTSLPDKQQIRYVKGGHGAAVEEQLWASIAEFIVYGNVPELSEDLRVDKRVPLVAIGGVLSPLIWLLLIILVGVVGVGVWAIVWPEWLKSGALLLYIAFVWTVITRL
jgi:pimeloyl-ACP methyl ester carboxylesterase